METIGFILIVVLPPFALITVFTRIAGIVCGKVRLSWKACGLFAFVTTLCSGLAKGALGRMPFIPTSVMLILAGAVFALIGAALLPQYAVGSSGSKLAPRHGALIGGFAWLFTLAMGFVVLMAIEMSNHS